MKYQVRKNILIVCLFSYMLVYLLPINILQSFSNLYLILHPAFFYIDARDNYCDFIFVDIYSEITFKS
jgi:hypothetical protein